jgi:DNA-binding FadR family transcriptional regulator
MRSSRLSRAEALARELEEEISAGVLSTGDRLGTKEDLRQRFNVAVATVNEAVKLLDTRGLVDARPGPGGGLFVAAPSSRVRKGSMIMGFQWTEATMADYHEVRHVLEPLICRHAARHHRHTDIRALETILASMEAHLDEPLAYVRDNTAFHRRIAKLCVNIPLRSLYVTLVDFFERGLERQELPRVLNAANIEVHRQLAHAIAAGEGPALEAAIRHHNTHQLSLGLFRPPPGTGFPRNYPG